MDGPFIKKTVHVHPRLTCDFVVGHGVDVEGDVEGSLAQIFVSARASSADADASHVAAEKAVA